MSPSGSSPPSPVPTVFGKPKLLIVDDQTINIQVLHQVFVNDYHIFMAASGEQALALCARLQPDLVLLDVMMPAMDGYQVCEQLQANPLTHNIPVIFVTASQDEAAETRGLEAGAVDFITKPINPNIVRARVKTHITLKRQSDMLRTWAYLDGLTGIHNRRHFEEQLVIEWGRAARSNTPLSVLLLDVDFFKRFNDHYGHQTGDECLRRVTSAVKSSLKRPADHVARYGGEEFVCVLPETDLTAATQMAEHIREAVFALQIPHSDSVTASVVTISLGVFCTFARAGGSAEELVHQADLQLYAAKAAGRNRVSAAEFNPA
jgi:diguanylate cyclase (GGDEF)-like protein